MCSLSINVSYSFILYMASFVLFVTFNISSSQASEVEETMKRIQSHKGVVGTIVVNSEGNCLLVI